MDHCDEFSKQFFKLEVTIEIALRFGFWREEDLEVLVEDDMNQIVHETGVEAAFSLNFECDAQQLIVEYPDVGVHVVLKHLEDSVRADQIVFEELGFFT